MRAVTISFENIEECDVNRADKLNEFFLEEGVELVLPCLLAYGSPGMYNDESTIDQSMMNELNYIVEKLDDEFGELVNVDYSIKILFIPIRELKLLRDSMEV